tara:strand:+ start:154 stop:1218 length:1065 start_codon:yes stop_codon:yes gene_type:complete
MSNYEELRYLTDVANDPALENAKRKFKKGINKLKKKLKKGTRKSSEFQIKKNWQRGISGNSIISYEQFDPELATVCVVSVRPEHLGGGIILVDGQHTGLMDIFGECDQELDTLELHHSSTATLEEVQKREAELYKLLNTKQKKLSKLDIIRVDIFLEEDYARTFENILKACNLNIDGIGAIKGDIIPGKGARMIKTIEQYGEDFSHQIIRAVRFMREKWGTETNPLKEYRDDMIHGLTTLFTFIDNAGKIEGGTPNGLNGKKRKLLDWMESQMATTSIRKYVHETAGGNTHFKIAHKIIEEYNFWADENAATMTISRDFLHANGIYDPKKFYGDEAADKAAKNALPTFPADINI